jgi:hypothetical protein
LTNNIRKEIFFGEGAKASHPTKQHPSGRGVKKRESTKEKRIRELGERSKEQGARSKEKRCETSNYWILNTQY